MPVYRHDSGLTPREHAMAGQPPEPPSWQPVGQDQTQARAAWPPPPPQQQAQSPSFTPQNGAPQGGAPQDGYGYPQQSTPGYPPPPITTRKGLPLTIYPGSAAWGGRI